MNDDQSVLDPHAGPTSAQPQDVSDRSVICLIWEQYAAYHDDRCQALAEALADDAHIVGIEMASYSDTYDWEPTPPKGSFKKITLFPGKNIDRISNFRAALALIRCIFSLKAQVVFVCGYEKLYIFVFAVLARTRGIKIILMNDSKYSDKRRVLSRELGKRLLTFPYCAGLASGKYAAEYMKFLGVKGPINLGYDTVSLDRLRRLVDGGPSLTPWHQRPFLIVSRLIEKKNIFFALDVFSTFLVEQPTSERNLVICGGGPLESVLRAKSRELGIEDRLILRGSVGQTDIAKDLSEALCLILPSFEEQWGLVVNEAIAFGLPIIASDQVGAADELVRTLCNGWVLKLNDHRSWVNALIEIDQSRELHDRFSRFSHELSGKADVRRFAQSCVDLIRTICPVFSVQADWQGTSAGLLDRHDVVH